MVARPPAPPALGVVHLGRVTRFDAGPFVEVPALRADYSYGPARVAETLSARLSSSTAAGTGGSHTHTVGRPLAVGDSVLVVFVGRTRDELVVVDRLLPPG